MKKSKKKLKEFLAKYNFNKLYSIENAVKIIKEITKLKFDASFDIAVRLGIDPKKSDQMIRGNIMLPHGTGKTTKILVLCTPDKEKEAKEAGADFVGLDDYIKKIEAGWIDFDILVTMPAAMAKVGKLGKILGPRNLMPNPKSGTVTTDIKNAIKEIKAGRINFKNDKTGIIHAGIGKLSFENNKLRDNILEFLDIILKLKPSSAKGSYFKSISLSSTMSKGIFIDKSILTNLVG